MKEYAAYKGEVVLCVGTIKEIAEYMGVKEKTVKFYLTKSYQDRLKSRKSTKQAIEVILLDD